MTSPANNVIQTLQTLDAGYEIIQIDPMFSDTVAFCEKYGFPPDQTCNTILVASRKEPRKFAACVILASSRLDVNRCVKKLLQVSKVSFASAEETVEITGMQLGGVTPFSLPPDLPLYVDEQVTMRDWVILGGGSREIKVKTSPDVLIRLGAQVVRDLAV